MLNEMRLGKITPRTIEAFRYNIQFRCFDLVFNIKWPRQPSEGLNRARGDFPQSQLLPGQLVSNIPFF
jgi:hypothetical protein